MAGIDKIYGTQKEYDKFYDWAKENNKALLPYFYDRYGYDLNERPITNFPEKMDKWLLKHCPLKFVTDRIKEQYGLADKEKKE